MKVLVSALSCLRVYVSLSLNRCGDSRKSDFDTCELSILKTMLAVVGHELNLIVKINSKEQIPEMTPKLSHFDDKVTDN